MKCQALYCNRRRGKDPGIKFYRFPKNRTIRREWVRFCVQNDEEMPFMKITAGTRMCSYHFPDGKGTTKAPNIPTRRDPKPEVIPDPDDTPEGSNSEFSLQGKETHELKCEIIRLRAEVEKHKRLASRWKGRYSRLNRRFTSRAEFKLFREDQMKLLSGTVSRVKNWSPETIIECEQLWKACPGGYDALIKRGFPLPSVRTLQRQIGLVRNIIKGEEVLCNVLQSNEEQASDPETIIEANPKETITTNIVIEPVHHDHRGYYLEGEIDDAGVTVELVSETILGEEDGF
ncbi:uncharacterized protein LOC129722048 [Wyeomyia smithii]|uniref:uncharacterized protein LOC129722048 n=1 Tax=Wyeomyia smithii TaxID=174621 RepID=UPI002467B555|nr:uncharacterized protein LOC129722048 [Wyeomyia smithii]